MKPYKVGYVAGVFDLFHVGHLNLFEAIKEKCGYLIVGVLVDELVMHFKQKLPIIKGADRMRIVEALKCVDRAVPVTASNIDKLKAWEIYRFDCLFSGDDWKNEPSWIEDRKKLQALGSNIEFLPYTKGISSTQIKEVIYTSLGKKGYQE